MKTVLIPTDYRTESLQYIPQLLSKFYPEEVEVVMVHMMSVTDCERELMMLSRRSAEYKHISDDFYKACLDLRNKHQGQLKNIRLEFFYGNTTAVFRNFIDANEIDFVLQQPDYEYRMLNKASINPVEMINRCRTKITKIHTFELDKKPMGREIDAVKETIAEPMLAEQYI